MIATAWGTQGRKINLENGPILLGNTQPLGTGRWQFCLVHGNMYSWLRLKVPAGALCSHFFFFKPRGSINFWECMFENSLHIKSCIYMFSLFHTKPENLPISLWKFWPILHFPFIRAVWFFKNILLTNLLDDSLSLFSFSFSFISGEEKEEEEEETEEYQIWGLTNGLG